MIAHKFPSQGHRIPNNRISMYKLHYSHGIAKHGGKTLKKDSLVSFTSQS